MKKKTKKAIELSSETLYQLEKKEAKGPALPYTPASHIGCCP